MPLKVDDPEAYFRKLIYPRDKLLLRLEAEAKREDIPIIGPVVGELLYILIKTTGATQVLELGTATGYSAIYLGRACRDAGGKVVTLEKDPAMAARARGNLQAAGLDPTVEVVLADARQAVAEMARTFDLAFIDIEKEDYIRVLPDIYRLLRPGGLLVADNVSYKGADTFNRAVIADGRWRAASLYAYLPLHRPENDGLCLAVKL